MKETVTKDGITVPMRPEKLQQLKKSQGILANLLSKSGVTVLFSGNLVTAHINMESGNISLPDIMYFVQYMQDDFMGDELYTAAYDVYTGFVVHEVAHSRYTPKTYPDAVKDMSDKMKVPVCIVFDVFNIFEDPRIERMIVRDFPGTFYYLKEEYVYLLSKGNFFQNDPDKDRDAWVYSWSKLGLLERINVYAKLRFVMEDYPDFRKKLFHNKAENNLVDRVLSTETFNDVINLVEFYLMSRSKNIIPIGKVEDLFDLEPESVEDEESTDDESNEPEDDFSDNNLLPDWGEQEIDIGQEQDSNEDAETNFDSGPSTTSGENEEEPEDTEEHDDVNREFFKAVFYNSKETGNFLSIVLPKLTENDYKYFDNNWGTRIYSSQISPEIFSKRAKTNPDIMGPVNSLAKHMNSLFQQMKAADQYKREMVSKTGDINPNALHRYRTDEDIFLNKTIVPGDENHGVIFVLDASSSMSTSAKHSSFCLVSMLRFCDMARIPYMVFAFPGKSNVSGTVQKSRHSPDSLEVYSCVGHLEYLSSSKDPKRHSANAFLGAVAKGSALSTNLAYGGRTPLSEAALNAFILAKGMKKREKIQHMSVVFITDGGSYPTYTTVGNGGGSPSTVFIEDQKRFLSYSTQKSKLYTFQSWFHMFSEWAGVRCVNWYINDQFKAVEIHKEPFVGHDFHLTINSPSSKLNDQAIRKTILGELIGEISGYNITQYGK